MPLPAIARTSSAVEAALRKAERPPFTGWYGPTWIAQRNQDLVEPRRGLAKLLVNAAR